METSDYLAALRRESAAFAAAGEAGLDRSVPACPEWRVADLVYHLTEVQDFWRRIVAERLTAPDGVETAPRVPDDELVPTFRAGAVALEKTLAGVDPSTPLWSWARRKDAGFVVRRMAHEAAVHRWDAESAHGQPAPIEPNLAADGIDEFAAHFAETEGEALSPVRIESTDVAAGTVLHAGAGGAPVGALHGSASDLLLVLWRRVPLSSVAVDGDAAAVAAQIGATDLE